MDFFNKSPNPMWIYDLETLRFLEVNQATINLYGWTRKEFLSMTILDIRPPSDIEKVRASVADNGIHQSSGPWRHLHKDGSKHLVRITSYPAEFRSRQARVVTVTDVTDAIHTNEALRQSEAELRALTDQLPVALLYVDAHGKCRRANRAFEEWFDISRDEVLKLDFEYFVLRGDGSKQYEADVRRAWATVSQGISVQFEKAIVIRGKRRIIEATYTPDFEDSGAFCGFTILLHDITEQRALEDQFHHAQKMEAIGRLAGGIAHDFNNILSIMNGYARILEQELDRNTRLGHMSGEIYRAGERAARLTQQLLAFSRKQISQPRIVRVDDLLRDDETMLRRLVSDTVFLEIHPGAGKACIEIDPHRFSQVLLNLVVNARDAMQKGGTLTIASRVHQQHVLISVQDTGCGMPVAVKERLFEPFFTTKEEGKGTGLGLATVYGIVREAAGTISVDSAENIGSTFIVSLPIVHQRQTRTAVSGQPSNPGHGSETVLLIEDDANIRYLLAHTLESCGYRVVQAENGLEGLNIAKRMLPTIDVVISDAIMPRMNGQEVIANLRRLRPDLKAMLVSGHIDADPKDVTGDPHTAFLYKPVPPEILTAELRRLLD